MEHGSNSVSASNQDCPHWAKPMLLSAEDESDLEDDNIASIMSKKTPAKKKRRLNLSSSSKGPQRPASSVQKRKSAARSGRPLGQTPSVAQWLHRSAEKYSLQSLLAEMTTAKDKPKYSDFANSDALSLSDSDEDGESTTQKPEDFGAVDDLDVEPHYDIFGDGPENLPEPILADLGSVDGAARTLLAGCWPYPLKMKTLLKSGWLAPSRVIEAGGAMLDWLLSMAAYEREAETAQVASRLLIEAITRPVYGASVEACTEWTFSAEKTRNILQAYGAPSDLLSECSQLQGKVMDLTSDDTARRSGSVESNVLPLENLRCVLHVLTALLRSTQDRFFDNAQVMSISLLLLKASLDSRISSRRWELEVALFLCLRRLASIGDSATWVRNARDLAKKIVSFTNGLRSHQLGVLDIIPAYTEECAWFRSRLALSFLGDCQDCFSLDFIPYETVTSLFREGGFRIRADTDFRQLNMSVAILVYVLYDEQEMNVHREAVREMIHHIKGFNSSIMDQGPNNLNPTILKDKIQRLCNRLELQISHK